jgi:hypothetical protein
VPQGIPETQPSKPLRYTWPTQTPFQQAGYHTVLLSNICRGTPIYGQSKYVHNMHTLCGTVLRTSSPRIRNYADSDGETGTGRYFLLSHAAPRHIRMAQVITQSQKLHSQLVGVMTAVMYQVTGLTCYCVYSMGLQPMGIIDNNVAGDTNPLLFFHMQPANQPTIMGVDLCHKMFGRPWFTETRVIRYQPFVSVHNAPFHSECYTTDTGSNKTYENNIILPTNIQYLKIHICN